MTEKRFRIRPQDNYFGVNDCLQGFNVVNGIRTEIEAKWLCDLLNTFHEEIQSLKRHIKRNTFSKIRVEDILNCAKYDRFYDNKEAIKSIDWIAEELGIDL